MNFGVILPGGTATEQLDLAILAEEAHWDGVYVWKAAYSRALAIAAAHDWRC